MVLNPGSSSGGTPPAHSTCPSNITPIFLPSRAPELNPVENIWQYLRANWLSNRVFDTYDRDHRRCLRSLAKAHRPARNHHVHTACAIGHTMSDQTRGLGSLHEAAASSGFCAVHVLRLGPHRWFFSTSDLLTPASTVRGDAGTDPSGGAMYKAQVCTCNQTSRAHPDGSAPAALPRGGIVRNFRLVLSLLSRFLGSSRRNRFKVCAVLPYRDEVVCRRPRRRSAC